MTEQEAAKKRTRQKGGFAVFVSAPGDPDNKQSERWDKVAYGLPDKKACEDWVKSKADDYVGKELMIAQIKKVAMVQVEVKRKFNFGEEGEA